MGPPDAPTSGSPAAEHVILAAGDIADCDDNLDEETAGLLAGLLSLEDTNATVVTLGDLAYSSGTAEEFAECYDPTWGQYKERTIPVVGNHEYETSDAEAYFEYFGAAAGDPEKGYHSLDIGSWHVIVLNSNCEEIGGCETGSPQESWLRQDLDASGAACTLALWHEPRYSSGYHGSDDDLDAFWDDLHSAGAELVLNGHDHNYERFEPQGPSAEADPDHGLTEIVVGTGGTELRDMDEPIANSAVRNSDTHGVLELTLADSSARWRFWPVPGESFTDTGSLTCHGKPDSPSS